MRGLEPTFTGGLEAQQNFRKIRSLAENICHFLRNSTKIFRFLDLVAAAHVTITTAKKYLFEICDAKTSRFYKKRIGSLKSTFATGPDIVDFLSSSIPIVLPTKS